MVPPTSNRISDLARNPDTWSSIVGQAGRADPGVYVVAVGPDPKYERAACFAAAAVTRADRPPGPAVAGPTILLPPQLARSRVAPPDEPSFIASVANVLRSRPADFGTLPRVVTCPNLLTVSVVAELTSCPEGTAAFVADTALFHPDVTAVAAPEAQDRGQAAWDVAVARLAGEVLRIAQARRLCVVLDTGALLDGVRPAFAEVPKDVHFLLASSARGETQDASERELPSGLADAIIRAEGLLRDGRGAEAFGALVGCLRDLPSVLSGESLLRYALLASEVGYPADAGALLKASCDSGIVSYHGHRIALHLASVLRRPDLVCQLQANALQLFPETDLAIRCRLASTPPGQGFETLAASAQWGPGTSPLVKAARVLAKHLNASVSSYAPLLAEIRTEVPSQVAWATCQCIVHALRHGNLAAAIELATSSPQDETTIDASLVVLQGALDEIRAGTGGKQATQLLGEVLEYVSRHPDDARVRSTVAALLSPAYLGYWGASYLALAIRSGLALPEVDPGLSDYDAPAAPEAAISFADDFLSEIERRGRSFALGVGSIPPSLLSAATGPMLAALVEGVTEAGRCIASEEHALTLSEYVHVALVLARHLEHHLAEYDIYRVFGGAMARAGCEQAARDLAEDAIVHTRGESDWRRYLAWLCFADLSHRAHDHVGGLIGVFCALRVGTPDRLSPAVFWWVATLAVRVLRDVGATSEAQLVADALARHCAPNGALADYAVRLDALVLSILAVRGRGAECDGEAENARAMRSRILRVIEGAARGRCDPFQVCGIIAGLLDVHGSDPELPRDELETALASLVDTLQSGEREIFAALYPSTSDLTASLAILSSQRTRYFHDVASDMAPLVMAARRALKSAADTQRSEHAVFASECLAVHDVRRRPESDDPHRDPIHPELAPRQSDVIRDPDGLLACAREVAASDAVTFLAFDSSGHMVHSELDPVRGPRVSRPVAPDFTEEAIMAWARTFPYQYGLIERADPFAIEMRRSVQPFQIDSASHAGQLLLVTDRPIASLPANLLVEEDEYLGARTPVAWVPSLSWLTRSRRVERPRAHGKAAWIAPADISEGISPLQLLREEILPCLTEHGFALSEASSPGNLGGARVVVVAAHGAISEGRMMVLPLFRELKGETESSVSQDELAQAVAGSDIVVLFVCSGGRLDALPYSRGTVGLPWRLLAAGVRCVIASPWPLEVAVPGIWLPAFLSALAEGGSPGRATFRANAAVRTCYAHPARWLAMHVYGDPDA